MEIIIALAIVAVGAVWYFNRDKGFDANKDGKVNLDDVKPLAETTAQAVAEVAKKAADVNKDGKVDVADAKEAVKKVKATAKKAAPKAKTPAKKATPRLKVAK
jgi:hypothetical protein